MKVDFYKAHNGLPSIKVNGIPLHSSYDPLKEAERAVESAAYKFRPSWIFVVEPGLSYCADFFRKKFPDTKLCALRFLKLGVENDLKWDKVIYDSGKDILSEKIFNCMGDEGVASCFFWTWPASEKIFPDETKAAWEEIKKVVIKTRNILNTRSYFAKRWIRNSTRFCLFSHYNAYILKGGIPVIVCASGPSLKSSIEYLKMYRDFYFLIAVSSALAPLTNEGIIPDLCLSTDGGYWAKLHLEFALKKYNIPIALSPEAACYAETLDKHTVVPISYGDGVAEELLSLCNYINVPAIRNGTVSGTAADLALNITTAEVFFCGLDLAPNPGFSHTQPNELEINGSCSDNRFCTQETRITPYTFNSPALDIYKAWFSETDFCGRLFRLSNNFNYSNKLGKVYDVDWNFFRQHISSELNSKPTVLYIPHEFELKDRIRQLSKSIKDNCMNREWIKCALPQEQITLERSSSQEQKKESLEKIKESMNRFTDEIIRTFDKGLKL